MTVTSTAAVAFLAACLSLAAPVDKASVPSSPATPPGATAPQPKPDPKEEKLKSILDQNIAGVSLPGVTLQEAIEILKTQLGRNVNFEIDPKVFANEDILITIDMKNVPVRRLLLSTLNPKGLNFITRDGSIYISTFEGCRMEEARPENMSLRVYDVADVLGAFPRRVETGKDTTAVARDVLGLAVNYTGAVEWDVMDVGLPPKDAAGKEIGRPTRLIFLRGPSLTVRHCPRIHAEVERCLTELRAQLKPDEVKKQQDTKGVQ